MDDSISELTRMFGDNAGVFIPTLKGLVGIAAAGYFAKEFANNLGSPAFRWTIAGAVALLCLVALRSRAGRAGTVYVDGEKKAVIERSRTNYLLVFICVVAYLVVDVTFVLRSYRTFYDLGEVTWQTNRNTFRVFSDSAPRDPRVKRLDALASTDVFSTDKSATMLTNLGFDFAIRKRDNLRELKIKNINVIVEEFEPLPSGIAPHTGMAYGDYAILAFIQLEKKDSELPWVFPATLIQLGGKDEGIADWKMRPLVLDSGAQRTIIVKLTSSSEGMFKCRATAELEPDLGKSITVSLGDTPHWLGFYKPIIPSPGGGPRLLPPFTPPPNK